MQTKMKGHCSYHVNISLFWLYDDDYYNVHD